MMIKVMTFNIKNMYSREKNKNFLEKRAHNIRKIIISENPDIIGLQEITNPLYLELTKLLPEYNFYGRSRYNNGKKYDEYNLVLVSKKIKVLSSETYSLGPNKDKVKSRYLFELLPRIVTMVKVLIKNKPVNIYNTHLDYLFSKIRIKELTNLKNIIDEKRPTIIMGDFNINRQNPLFQKYFPNYLNASDKLNKPSFQDKYLDHIFYSKDFILSKASISQSRNFPSDHFPVTAYLKTKF